MQVNDYITFYKEQLLEDVIPYWLKHSGDDQLGGYFTCLDTQGKVYDTDKFVWLQGREVWCFAMLYNQVEPRQEWLDFAIQGAEFLLAHGRDKEGKWYFSLTREGQPLTQPYSIFSDCFAAMAFAQLYKATNSNKYKEAAVLTFHNILQRKEDPKGNFSKVYPGTRPTKGFSLPMILCNLVLEMEPLLSPELVKETLAYGTKSVMEDFFRPELGIILENISEDGGFIDSFEGRLVNPGHGQEAMWFIMDVAERTSDRSMFEKASAITLSILEYGWDKKYGGIFYFLDVKGHPPQQLEWDQKLWWVHLEAMISLLKGYLHTGNESCWQWFEKVHDYSWKHFHDAEYGEWYGYLNRQGKVLLPMKGGKWKGCFHVPRGLYQCWKTLSAIQDKTKNQPLTY
jgi:N-acylglucosamine 2-epimerase